MPAPLALAVLLFVTSLFVQANAAATCGVKGYDDNGNDYYYDDSGSQGGYTACSSVCLMDSKCQSFAYSTTECLLFQQPAAAFVQKDNTSPYTFYNSACAQATKSSSTLTTHTTSTAHSTSSAHTNSPKSTTSSTHSTLTSLTIKTSTSHVVSTSTATIHSTSAGSSTSTGSIPPGCTLPASFIMNSLSWYNSTHNLDCVTGPDVGNGTACINTTTQWCTPYGADTTCTNCGVNVCSGGLPPSPPGYGPPDQINIAFNDGTTCTEMNPQGYRRHEVGNDIVPCEGSFQYINFYGSSNAAANNGSVSLTASGSCSNGQYIYGTYGASFEVDCTHDSGFNATCSAKANIAMALTSFSLSS